MKKLATKLMAACALALVVGVFLVGPATAADKIVVGFSQIGAESAWRVANTESITSEAAKRPNIDLKFSDAQQKQENQIKAIRNFIAQDVDVIAFSPVVETGWTPVLKEAKRAGIPVILSDRAVDTEDDTLWVTFMGSDFVEEGRRSARLARRKLRQAEERADKSSDGHQRRRAPGHRGLRPGHRPQDRL